MTKYISLLILTIVIVGRVYIGIHVSYDDK